ncbi:hypothetical protein [Flavobacterium luminosum]|uniref:Uncharacterized protein n=1 Tax=Flavobacterium luminosum TaxID=2949086 RepID=A0ABT0TRY4_9FLAO|nr:hypothetical protein [Flavobacterium sp. HXWNR70]MCL9810135.1 hypothetical protein [Flavobacterium sp. HXWNR70]
MNKLIFKLISIIIGIFFLIILYINSSSYIENQTWKYSHGNWIGDWLVNENMKIENRIIYTHKGEAKIVYCFLGQLVVENIATGKKGYYIDKN